MPRRQSPRRKRSRRSKTKRKSPKRSLRRRRYRASQSSPPLLQASEFSQILAGKDAMKRESKENVQWRQRMQRSIADRVEEREQRRSALQQIYPKPATATDERFETPFIHGADGRHILPLYRLLPVHQLLGYRNDTDGIELYSVEIVLESEGGPFMFLPLTKWDPIEWRSIDTTKPLGREQILDPKNPAGVHLFAVQERLVPDWGSVSSFLKEVTRETSSTFTYTVRPTGTYTVSPMVLTDFLNDNDDQIFHMVLLHRKTPTGGVSVIAFSAEKGFGYKLSLAEHTMPPVPEMGRKGTGRILADPGSQSSPSRRTSPFELPSTVLPLVRRKSRVGEKSPSGPASARV